MRKLDLNIFPYSFTFSGASYIMMLLRNLFPERIMIAMSILKTPQIGENVFIAQGAVLLGDVTIKKHSSIWFNAVVRADMASIAIGESTNIQDNCTLHVDAGAALSIGNQVTIGHGAVVHGCTIGDNTLIGMGAIILNHAVIGKNCIIGAGALVTQNTVIPDNSLEIGNPGKVKRVLTSEEIEGITENAQHYVEEAAHYMKDASSKI